MRRYYGQPEPFVRHYDDPSGVYGDDTDEHEPETSAEEPFDADAAMRKLRASLARNESTEKAA